MSWVIIASYDELGLDWQLLSSQAQCFFGYLERHAIDFDNHTTGGYRCHESFGVTFTFTHAHIGRFACDWFVGEYAYPNLTLTLHIACYGYTGGLDLLASNPNCSQRLDAKRAERKLVAALGDALRVSVLLSSVFCLFRL